MAMHTEGTQMILDLQHIQKLKYEQQKGLDACMKKIEQWEKFKADYEALHKRLTTLADKVSHDVNVPIGNVAFMPGKMIHTNEILVLLGDNWFVERSAKQAAEIVDRRIKQCATVLEKLAEENRQFQNWMQYTNEIAAESNELVEICETYDAEEEKLWREKHKESIKKCRQQNFEENHSLDKGDHACFTAEDVFARLDDLEKQEQSTQELASNIDACGEGSEKESLKQKSSIDPISEDQSLLHKPTKDFKSDSNKSSNEQKKGRRVQWLDQTNFNQQEELDEPVIPLLITFRHTDPEKQEEMSDQDLEAEQQSEDPISTIKSPSDIYVHYASYLQTTPKSILKKTLKTNNGLIKSEQSEDPSYCMKTHDGNKSNPVSFLNSEQVVSDTVVEKDPSSSVTATVPQHRPLSRFKARRKVINP